LSNFITYIYSAEEEKEEVIYDHDSLEGQKFDYVFFYLYDGSNPITDKSRHRISIGVHQCPKVPQAPTLKQKFQVLFYNGQDIEKVFYHDDIK
jgi:hypothetical protein